MDLYAPRENKSGPCLGLDSQGHIANCAGSSWAREFPGVSHPRGCSLDPKMARKRSRIRSCDRRDKGTVCETVALLTKIVTADDLGSLASDEEIPARRPRPER